jgi:hypothetical protein
MERSFAAPAFQPAPRTALGTPGGSSVGDHAWLTSFGKRDLSNPQQIPHFSTKSELENYDTISETEH